MNIDDAKAKHSQALNPLPTKAHKVTDPLRYDSFVAQPIRMVSFALVAVGLLLVMIFGMLPGLLAVFLSILLTRWLNSLLLRTVMRFRHHPSARTVRWLSRLSALIVSLTPLIIIYILLVYTQSHLVAAPQQILDLSYYVAHTVGDLITKMPVEISGMLPRDVDDIHASMTQYMLVKAGALAKTGRIWLVGFLYAYIGVLIGALAAIPAASVKKTKLGPLSAALKTRFLRLAETFRQIVTAQFWIASLNTCLTAIFLLVLLPIFGLKLPHASVLVMLTFIAGLIPIVGNLFCNVVITMVGLSVSVFTAIFCLIFLVLIHKAEYFINAKVVGRKTHIKVWELLTVMFVFEAIFGPAGLVAAPLFYAYLKKELKAEALI